MMNVVKCRLDDTGPIGSCADLQDLPLKGLYGGAQLYPPIYSTQRANRLPIARGMKPVGFTSEKIAFEDLHMQEKMRELYEDFKRLNGYSDMEISQKCTEHCS